MIIFLYLILVLAWALLILILKCKKARAKRLAELQEAAQQVHVVQIGSNLYDIMSIQQHPHQHHHHHHHRPPYGTVYDCLGSADHHPGAAAAARSSSTTHSNAAFVGDDGSVYPGSNISPLEPPPSYDEVIRLPAHYPKVETFVPEMVVPPPPPPPEFSANNCGSGVGGGDTGSAVPGAVVPNGGPARIKAISTVMNT